MPFRPDDIFFAVCEWLVALILFFKIQNLPGILTNFLALVLVISGILDLFGA